MRSPAPTPATHPPWSPATTDCICTGKGRAPTSGCSTPPSTAGSGYPGRRCSTAGPTRTWLSFTGAGRDRTIRLCPSPDGTVWNPRNILPGPQSAAGSWPSVVGRSGAGRADRLLLAWPDQNGAVWCALSQDAAQHWSQPAPVPARTLRGVAFAGWDTVDAYAAWAVAPDGDYSIFWADTTGSTVWRHPHTGHLLQHGQGRLDERASLREPAMAAHGHMWR